VVPNRPSASGKVTRYGREAALGRSATVYTHVTSDGQEPTYSVEKLDAKTALATSISVGFDAVSLLREVIGPVLGSDRAMRESGPGS